MDRNTSNDLRMDSFQMKAILLVTFVFGEIQANTTLSQTFPNALK